MTHLTRETHRPDSQYTGGPLFILHLHTRAANSWDTIDQRVLMLGRCDRMGCTSPWLPAPQTLPRRSGWRRHELPSPFQTHRKSTDRKGRISHSLELQDLAQHSHTGTFPGMSDTAPAACAAKSLRCRCDRLGFSVTRAMRSWLVALHLRASSNLHLEFPALESANSLCFGPGDRDTPGSAALAAFQGSVLRSCHRDGKPAALAAPPPCPVAQGTTDLLPLTAFTWKSIEKYLLKLSRGL